MSESARAMATPQTLRKPVRLSFGARAVSGVGREIPVEADGNDVLDAPDHSIAAACPRPGEALGDNVIDQRKERRPKSADIDKNDGFHPKAELAQGDRLEGLVERA